MCDARRKLADSREQDRSRTKAPLTKAVDFKCPSSLSANCDGSIDSADLDPARGLVNGILIGLAAWFILWGIYNLIVLLWNLTT